MSLASVTKSSRRSAEGSHSPLNIVQVIFKALLTSANSHDIADIKQKSYLCLMQRPNAWFIARYACISYQSRPHRRPFVLQWLSLYCFFSTTCITPTAATVHRTRQNLTQKSNPTVPVCSLVAIFTQITVSYLRHQKPQI